MLQDVFGPRGARGRLLPRLSRADVEAGNRNQGLTLPNAVSAERLILRGSLCVEAELLGLSSALAYVAVA